MSVSDDLNRWIESTRSLVGFGNEVAPEVARVIKADLEDSIAAGETPDGEKWKPTLEGKQPLRGAASALYITAYKGTIFVRVKGPEALHHKGAARGKIARQIIPYKKRVPERMAAKIRRVLDAEWQKRVSHG